MGEQRNRQFLSVGKWLGVWLKSVAFQSAERIFKRSCSWNLVPAMDCELSSLLPFVDSISLQIPIEYSFWKVREDSVGTKLVHSSHVLGMVHRVNVNL